MPAADESIEGWVARLRTWNASLPKKNGRRVFAAPGAETDKPKGVDWEEEGRRALALTRIHDLQVKRGKFMPRDQVVDEWARRAFAASRRFLALPRQIAGAVTAAPEVRAQIESEGLRLVREALLEFVATSESTPTPPALQNLDGELSS